MNQNHDLPVQYLPEGLKRIATYAGWDAMWALWSLYAGARVQIPRELKAQSGFVAEMGIEHAGKLIEAFSGEFINVPKADAARRAIRDKAIRAERANGVHVNIMCRKYQLTYRQLQTIFRGIDEMPPEETHDIFQVFSASQEEVNPR